MYYDGVGRRLSLDSMIPFEEDVRFHRIHAFSPGPDHDGGGMSSSSLPGRWGDPR